MKKLLIFLVPLIPLMGQEATSGFDLRATVTGGVVSNGSRTHAAFRSVFYPTFKLSEHWIISGGLQVMSEPFLPTMRFRVLNANLGYSRVWKNASLYRARRSDAIGDGLVPAAL